MLPPRKYTAIIGTPINGVMRSISREEPPEQSLISSLNVLPYDPDGFRRLSQRPGLNRLLTVPGGNFVQGMLAVGYIVPTGTVIGQQPVNVPFSSWTNTGSLSTDGTNLFFYGYTGSTSYTVAAPAGSRTIEFVVQYKPYIIEYNAPPPSVQMVFNVGNIAGITLFSNTSTDGTYQYVWFESPESNGSPVTSILKILIPSPGTPASGTLEATLKIMASYQFQKGYLLIQMDEFSYQEQTAILNPTLSPVTIQITGNGAGGFNPLSTSSALEIS